jgi:hypothetical protein
VIELLCYNWRFVNFWLEIWSRNWRFFLSTYLNPEGLYKIELCRLLLRHRLFLSCNCHGVTDRTCNKLYYLQLNINNTVWVVLDYGPTSPLLQFELYLNFFTGGRFWKLTGGMEGTLNIGRKMLPPEGSHVWSLFKHSFNKYLHFLYFVKKYLSISGNSPFGTPALTRNA